MKGAAAAERSEEKEMDLQSPSPASPTSLASASAPRGSYGTSKASTLHTYDSDSDDNSEVALAMSAASAGASSSWALEPHRNPVPGFSDEASSSSSSRAAEARPVSCEGGGGEDVIDLESPWVAAAEAESRLEEAVMAAAVAGLNLRAEEEAGEDEIRDNQQRQEDELRCFIQTLMLSNCSFDLIIRCS